MGKAISKSKNPGLAKMAKTEKRKTDERICYSSAS